jgi:hypothetical protein
MRILNLYCGIGGNRNGLTLPPQYDNIYDNIIVYETYETMVKKI